VRKRLSLFLRQAQRSYFIPARLRIHLLRAAGLEIGAARLSAGLHIGIDVEITIASGVFVNAGCFFDDAGRIHIAENVHIGPDVKLITTSHAVGASDMRAGERSIGTIRIERGCWLGAGVTILPNLVVAEGCVIAADAILTHSTTGNGLYAGVPARRIRDLPA
jgi:maltose O-acetyltransferase